MRSRRRAHLSSRTRRVRPQALTLDLSPSCCPCCAWRPFCPNHRPAPAPRCRCSRDRPLSTCADGAALVASAARAPQQKRQQLQGQEQQQQKRQQLQRRREEQLPRARWLPVARCGGRPAAPETGRQLPQEQGLSQPRLRSRGFSVVGQRRSGWRPGGCLWERGPSSWI